MKKIIRTLNLKTVSERTAEDEVETLTSITPLDLSEILEMPFLAGLEKAKEIGVDIVNKIKETRDNENGLSIILDCANDDTFEMVEAMIGHVVEALVDREKLRVPERYIGLATFDSQELLVGGNFNLLSLINYESGFDFIKIVGLNKDRSREKGLGVRR